MRLILFLVSFSIFASVELPKDINTFFKESHPSCFMIKKIGSKKIRIYNKKECEKRKIPCSTYKILNSLIALETGVIKGNKTIIPWDGEKKFIKAWEKDHTIATAIKYSVVPFYQEVARRIGLKRMTKYVELANYGNKKVGSEIDRFWLDGPIKISASEQLSFIEKLYTNQLPFKKENQEFVRRIIIQKRTNDSVFSGKTGSSYKDGKYRLGWFVGHIKKDNDEYVFVINSEGEGEAGHKLKKVAQKILSKMKI